MDEMTISRTNRRRETSSSDEQSPDDEGESHQIRCWICRQPLPEDQLVHWHGEPIHRDCL